MGSCFPGSSSLLCSSVFCKYSLRYLVFVKFFILYEKSAGGQIRILHPNISLTTSFHVHGRNVSYMAM